MDYEDARRQATEEIDPTVAANMDAWWARLKELEAVPLGRATEPEPEPEEYWAGWYYENDEGFPTYSRVHLLGGLYEDPVCGATPRRGVEWLAECDSPANRCSHCKRVTEKEDR